MNEVDKAVSTYYDFSPKFVWSWFFLSLFHWNISFYYDYEQQVYCRKVKKVKGHIEFDPVLGQKVFIPFHWLVHYRQVVWD